MNVRAEVFRKKVTFLPQSPAVESMIEKMCAFVHKWQNEVRATQFSLKRSGDGFVLEVVVHGQLQANADVLVKIVESIPAEERVKYDKLDLYLNRVKEGLKACGRHSASEPNEYFEIFIPKGEKWKQFCESFQSWVHDGTPNDLGVGFSFSPD